MNKKALIKSDDDNVATVLDNVYVGEIIKIIPTVNDMELVANAYIPSGNKIALKDISMKANIIKAGHIMGESTKVIKQGTLVHVHNVKSNKINFPPLIIKEILKQMKLEDLYEQDK